MPHKVFIGQNSKFEIILRSKIVEVDMVHQFEGLFKIHTVFNNSKILLTDLRFILPFSPLALLYPFIIIF